jgi:carbon catabolite-derepressing protein kinase
LEEGDARRIFQQIISGLEYIHSLNIIHADISLDSIFLDENKNVKISNFKDSFFLDEKEIFFQIKDGTPYYSAPEALSDSRFETPSDIWSCVRKFENHS